MKAFTHPLTTIFGKDVRYIVPLYQRPYVWAQESHWEPLWQDVLFVVRNLLLTEEAAAFAPQLDPPITPPHFLGAIVLDLSRFGTGSLELRSVIDGQQRLTTLQLMIAAASEVAANHNCDKEARLLRKLTENDPDLVVDPDDQFKVWPTNVDRAPFRSTMLRQNGSEEKNHIHKAYAYFAGAIDKWASDDDWQDIDANATARFAALTRVVREMLKLVIIDLEDGDNAQVIFETLNARGMPLLAIDLVKNLVFQRASAVPGIDLDAMYETKWKPFDQDYWREEVRQGRLNRPRAELFLMHWLTMQLADEVGAKHLFTTFRAHVDLPTGPPITTTVAEFASDAEIFQSFDHQPEGSVERRFFDRLDILDTTTALPIALFLFRQPETVLSLGRRRRALVILESWMVRRMICRLTTKNYNRFFLDLLKKLKASPATADDVILEELQESSASTNAWPTDEQVVTNLTENALYGQINQRRVVLVLSALEQAMRSNKSETLNLPAGLTIEHILPQSWKEHWPLASPNDVALVSDRDRHLHRIGNLTLVTNKLNPALSNSAWPIKREELNKHSVLLLNRRVVDEHPTEWTEDDIDVRSAELAQLIIGIWPGPSHSF